MLRPHAGGGGGTQPLSSLSLAVRTDQADAVKLCWPESSHPGSHRNLRHLHWAMLNSPSATACRWPATTRP